MSTIAKSVFLAFSNKPRQSAATVRRLCQAEGGTPHPDNSGRQQIWQFIDGSLIAATFRARGKDICVHWFENDEDFESSMWTRTMLREAAAPA